MAPPRAVVFDVGQVLYRWDIGALYRQLIPDAQRLDWFLTHVVTPEWHFAHDRGVPFADNAAALIDRFPAERELILAYGPRWLETIPGPVPGSPELVADLKAAGVPLYAITNFAAEFWTMFRPTAPLFDGFADIIVSGAEKLMKPDPAIFALGRSRFGLGDGEAVFIDDVAGNVEAAIAAGWHAIQFTDAAAARRDLRNLGFPV